MKKGTLAAIGIVVVVLAIAFAARIQQSKQKAEKAKATTAAEVISAVRVNTVGKKDLPNVVQITGSVKAHNEVQVLPKMPGRITSVRVDVGSVVKAGDTLAAVEAIDVALRVQQAEAQVAAAKAGLEQAKVQAMQAGRGLDRAKSLHDKGAMSQIEFENAENGDKLANVGVQAAEAQVALATANLGLANKALDDTRVTAPISGVVTKKSVNVGVMANPAMAAFAMQDQSTLKLEGTVPAAYVPSIKSGMKVDVTIDELPGRSFEGSVTRMAPTLEAETRRGAVEIALKPAEGVLPYMFGHAEIAFGNTADVVVVPSAAVLSIGGEPAVYVVRDEHAVLVRPRLGMRHLDDVVVEEGIAVGDQVVVSGGAGLKDGAHVSVQAP